MANPRDFSAWSIVPSADSNDNLQLSDVVGNKEDAAATAVSTTDSQIAYLKALFTGLTTTRAGYLDQYWRLDPDPVTAASDATVGSGAEENLLDLGADAGSTAYRLESGMCNVASLGTNTTITFRFYAEVNGTLTQIGSDVDRTATGGFDLFGASTDVESLAARHIRVTVTGDNAADDGSVAATFVTSIGGV